MLPTCSLDPALSRNALGSGAMGWPSRPCNELSELFTLPLGVELLLCGWGPGRPLSFPPGGPLSDAGWGGSRPSDEVSPLEAGGSALPCCLLFLPNRNDMVPGLQPSARYNGSGCRSRTHSVCTRGGQRVGWEDLGFARERCVLAGSRLGRRVGVRCPGVLQESRRYGCSLGDVRMSRGRREGRDRG